MKYKKLTKEQIIISLDRITRFKSTKEKYTRVFFDIILSNLIEPKYKKTELEKLDVRIITNYIEEIFNNSLDNTIPFTNIINKKLKDYENTVFYNDESTQILLDNKINYDAALFFIETETVVNLRWLRSLKYNNDMQELRERENLKFPIEKVLLVEGLTEEILLPEFSKFLGYDFDKYGIQIIGAGGKNQVVKMYYKLSQELKLPIFLLLDKDAEENIKQILPRLRKCDGIHPVSCGEFEDLLPKSLIVKTVNKHFQNFLTITDDDLNSDLPMAKCLEDLFKTRGLHEFKKSEFAKLVSANIEDKSDISQEIRIIIDEIFSSCACNKTYSM